ncbi:MAG: hypothetical protein IKZ49_03670 [Alphaproteobacteria bacterium]|nr:hypothetical protein [Alphaproteobacteria bacterium]
MKKQNRFDLFVSKLLYRLLVASHAEDYAVEQNGNVVLKKSGVWQQEFGRQRGC